MNQKFLLLSIIIVLAGIVCYKMIFSPVSVSFKSHPVKILVDSPDPILLEVFPVNRLGFRIPFGHLKGKFVVSEGKEKIEVVREKEDEFVFKTGNRSGRLVIFYYAGEIPFPIEIILNIEAASLATSDYFPISLDRLL